MIQIDSLSKSYANKCVLDEISLQLGPQQVHVLIGSSGSGKTTLLKLLAGVLKASGGTIFVGKEKIQGPDVKLERDYFLSYGYVIQNGGLFPHLNAEENIRLAVKNLNLDERDYGERLKELTELVQLAPSQLKKYPNKLSGGQQQRVGIIRSLINRPKLLLMDEPLGALDPIVRSDLQKDLKRIFETIQTTVVFVTHDMNEAGFFGDTITLLHDGKMVQHGGLRELVKSPATSFVTQFIQAQTGHALLRELQGSQ